MTGKTAKATPKMADVTKPKKLTNEDQLVIQSRPMIGRATSVSSPVDEEKQPEDTTASTTAPVLPSQSKRTLIVPVSDGAEKASTDASPKSAPVAADAKPAVADEAPKDAAPVEEKPAEKPASEPPADAKDDAPAKETDDKDEAAAEDEGSNTTDAKGEKPSPETEKALKEAAAAEKRANELQSLIDSKQFYVPINAVAQRRSIKYSSVMTVVVFLLAIVLIDLMLDTGMILLVQKIPHTHFFSNSSTK